MGDTGSIPGWGRSPGEGNGNPLVFLPENSHGQRSLLGYSPWGHKQLDSAKHACPDFIRFVYPFWRQVIYKNGNERVSF